MIETGLICVFICFHTQWSNFCYWVDGKIQQTHTHTQPFNGLWSGTTRVGRYQKKHSHPSWSSDILYHLPPFATINVIHSVHFTCLTVLSFNLSPGHLWPWTLNFILHTFLHPIIIFFSQHMPIPTQPVLLQYQCYVIYAVSQKKQDTKLLAITSPTIIRFSKFFH